MLLVLSSVAPPLALLADRKHRDERAHHSRDDDAGHACAYCRRHGLAESDKADGDAGERLGSAVQGGLEPPAEKDALLEERSGKSGGEQAQAAGGPHPCQPMSSVSVPLATAKAPVFRDAKRLSHSVAAKTGTLRRSLRASRTM